LKNELLDNEGNPYKNGRNLAAGSVRAFDSKVCVKRRVSFLPFAVLKASKNFQSLWTVSVPNCLS
jgi:DNA ligase (NAD+)